MSRIQLGVCAMDSKVSGKPMQAIISRMKTANYFEIVQFGDDCILNRPVEEWPLCEVNFFFPSIFFACLPTIPLSN
jgi:inositol hexakisphosphate/diphosphoinositol-pentakisphosphate kinase